MPWIAMNEIVEIIIHDTLRTHTHTLDHFAAGTEINKHKEGSHMTTLCHAFIAVL